MPHNVCFKKTWTNYSTVSLLWFVQGFFLKQMLIDLTTQPFYISQQKIEPVLCIVLPYRSSIQTSCLFEEHATQSLRLNWNQLELNLQRFPVPQKKYVIGRELLFGSRIHTTGSRIKKAVGDICKCK